MNKNVKQRGMGFQIGHRRKKSGIGIRTSLQDLKDKAGEINWRGQVEKANFNIGVILPP